MKRPVILGLIFIIAGISCIFPFIRAMVLENIVVMLGVYFIYRGYLYLTAPMQCSDACKTKKNGTISSADAECAPDCKK